MYTSNEHSVRTGTGRRAFTLLVAALLAISSVFSPGIIRTAYAADAGQYNTNLTPLSNTWGCVNSAFTGGALVFANDGDGEASLLVSLTDDDLIAAVDLGTARLTSEAVVTALAGAASDGAVTAGLTIRCGEDADAAVTAEPTETASLTADAAGAQALELTADIPAGTRCIMVSVNVTLTSAEALYARVTGVSSSFIDVTAPMVTVAYNSAWTSAPIAVTVTAADATGAKAIYASDGTKLADGGSYSFSVSTEGSNSRSFYAVDYAGNVSAAATAAISNYDSTAPAAIVMPATSAAWRSTPCVITLPALAPAAGQSPETYYVSTDGGAFAPFSGSAYTCSLTGSHTYSFKTADAAGNESAATAAVQIRYDAAAPVLAGADIEYLPGETTVTLTVTDALSGVALVKYAAGDRTAAYFSATGTDITDARAFTASASSDYTVYMVDNAGNASTAGIDRLVIHPTLGAIAATTVTEDAAAFQLAGTAGDDNTSIDDLELAAECSDPELLDALGLTKTAAGYTLDITLAADANTGDGYATVTVTATDADGAETEMSFRLTVTPVNDAPAAADDAAATAEDAAVTVDVLANDTDVENDTLSIVSFTQPAHGAVTETEGGLTYTPSSKWFGTDTFTYRISDGAATAAATVTVTVGMTNDAPVAADDTAATDEDTPVTISVLDNDTDADLIAGSPETLTVAVAAQPEHGEAAVSGGSIVYTPDADWYGTDSFTYTLTDAAGASDTAAVSVTVQAVNDAPVVGELPENGVTAA